MLRAAVITVFVIAVVYGQSNEGKKSDTQPTCTVKGDPHYITFDGFKYDYMGICSYSALSWCGGSYHNNPFDIVTVSTKEINPNNPGHTHIDSVTMYRFGTGHDVEVIGSDCTFMLNGDLYDTFPQEWPGLGSVDKNGNIYDVVVYDQYKVRYDCNKRKLEIILIFNNAQGKVCGMCGNYNGDDTAEDEFQGYGSAEGLADEFEVDDPTC